jgi:hypothetical protein
MYDENDVVLVHYDAIMFDVDGIDDEVDDEVVILDDALLLVEVEDEPMLDIIELLYAIDL